MPFTLPHRSSLTTYSGTHPSENRMGWRLPCWVSALSRPAVTSHTARCDSNASPRSPPSTSSLKKPLWSRLGSCRRHKPRRAATISSVSYIDYMYDSLMDFDLFLFLLVLLQFLLSFFFVNFLFVLFFSLVFSLLVFYHVRFFFFFCFFSFDVFF